jgi:GNAT superfamily N-acetyltransferase
VTPHEPSEPANCEIRRATLGDAEALFELVQQFATSFPPRREDFAVSLRRLVADASAWIAVAECDGAVIAYCLGFVHFTFYANGRVAWVEEITVRSESRRKGVGARLMAAFEEWARSRDAKLVALATRRAALFYAALGYEHSATYFRKLL